MILRQNLSVSSYGASLSVHPIQNLQDLYVSMEIELKIVSNEWGLLTNLVLYQGLERVLSRFLVRVL